MTSKQNLILIQSASKGSLSKKQQEFNKLSTRLETLKKKIEDDQKKHSRIVEEYNKEILPIAKQIAQLRIDLAFAIDAVTHMQKLSKIKKEYIGSSILFLLNDASVHIELDDTQIELYDKWADTSYEELQQEESDFYNEQLQDILRREMGIDVNLAELEQNPEKFIEFQEKLKEEYKKGPKASDNSPKTAKQQAKENLKKAEEELKRKSLRSVYINLAKALHPDTEQKEEQKNFKQELMKKVIIAYEQKDLFTLLSLELEWIHNTQKNLESMPDEKLNMYIKVLKDQEAQLKAEREMMLYNPDYEPVRNLLFQTEKQALAHIKKEVKSMQLNLRVFKDQIQEVHKGKLTFAYSFAKEFCHIKEQDNFMSLFFNE